MSQEIFNRGLLKIIQFSFYVLFFFTPLLMVQVNSELFETPKMFFVWALTIIITGAWMIRCLISGRLIFQRTPLDLPLVVFLLSQTISYYFSIDRHTSWWGYYSRFNGGLASLIAYSLLYWAYVANLTASHTLSTIRFLLISALLVALWGIPAHFGWDPTCALFGFGPSTSCWTADFVPTARIFSTLGQPNWLAAWLVALVPVGWALALQAINNTQKAIRKKIILITYYLLLITIFLLAILFTRSQSGFIGLGVAILVFLVGLTFFYRPAWTRPTILLIVCTGIIGLILFNHAPQKCLSIIFSQNPTTQEPNSPMAQNITPSSDIRCIVWKGAIAVARAHPLWGTGPETFAYSYYRYKPPEHNLTSEWNFLYNKAHNEYLNMAANTGVVGLTSYFILIGSILWLLGRLAIGPLGKKNQRAKEPKSLKALGLLAGWASILVTNFFGFSVVPIQLQFFLYPAMSWSLGYWDTKPPAGNKNSNSQIRQLLNYLKIPTAIMVLVAVCYLMLIIIRFYLADIRYSQAQNTSSLGNWAKALPAVRQAITLNHNEPVYLDEAASILSSLAALGYFPPDDQPQAVQLAVDFSNQAIAQSPQNINVVKTRAEMFARLATITQLYLEKAQTTYQQLAQLAPTDAQIQYDLAIFYLHSQQYRQAQTALEYTLQLRPRYREAQEALEQLEKEKAPLLPH